MDDTLKTMIAHALHARQNAYVPYSHYAVGAALRSTDGRVFEGCNVENAAYPACICGERTALVKAVSEGARDFDLLVVATENGGSPCGVCRQMLAEFAPDLPVVCVDKDGTIGIQTTLRGLLPEAFLPEHLPKDLR